VVDLDDAQVFSAVEASVGARLPVRTRVHEAQLLAYDGERFTCHAHLPLGGTPLG
jgi:hypothetical protein